MAKFSDYMHVMDKRYTVYRNTINSLNAIDGYGNKILADFSCDGFSDITCFIYKNMSDHFTFVCNISFDWHSMFIECRWNYKFRNSIIAKIDIGDITVEDFSKWFIRSVEHFTNFANIMENM